MNLDQYNDAFNKLLVKLNIENSINDKNDVDSINKKVRFSSDDDIDSL